MGKKRVVKKSKEELLEEQEEVSENVQTDLSEKYVKKEVDRGHVYIKSTYNNIIITLTDSNGNTILWKSAGSLGFKGTKKSTSYAGSKVAETIASACEELNIKKLDIYLKGTGSGRKTALKVFGGKNIEIESITDRTSIPHGGVTPPKKRRV